jgi:uncharacterized protein YeaO (DUF488 family)
MIQLKRAYEPPARRDGYRVLVDRLWPRGVRKDTAQIDEWLKDVAPSDALRRWFGHDPERFTEFRKRYKRELHAGPAHAALADLASRTRGHTVTLVYSAHDETHNNAVVLAEALGARPPRSPARATAKRPTRPAARAATRRLTRRSARRRGAAR